MAQTKEERNAYMREWNKKNRAKKAERDRLYREAHKEEIKAKHKEWRDRNRERLNEQQKERYKENPQMFKDINKRYKESHQEQIKEANKKYKQENRQRIADSARIKRQTDPTHRFRSSFICLIRGYLRKHGYKGAKTTWDIVGCDFDTFLEYITSQFEEGMTLENYGHRGGCWNIDHIVPISTAKTDEDLERLNHHTNLRPMWASENYKKSKKMP